MCSMLFLLSAGPSSSLSCLRTALVRSTLGQSLQLAVHCLLVSLLWEQGNLQQCTDS